MFIVLKICMNYFVLFVESFFWLFLFFDLSFIMFFLVLKRRYLGDYYILFSGFLFGF